MTLGEYSKTIDFKKYDRVIVKHDNDLIVVYENGQMHYSIETCLNEVIGAEVEKYNIGASVTNLVIEIDLDVRKLIE